MQKKEIETFYPESRKAWRQWLQKNHAAKQSIWLICYKKKSGKPTISWSEAVDEALCFGWIDSTRKTLDADSFIQFFGKRKAGGTWSKINKLKVEELIEQGLMRPAGMKSIETAKENVAWTILDSVDALEMPKDLEKEFRKHAGSKAFFNSLSKSLRKQMLYWLIQAKRPETRQKRIQELAALAAQKLKPGQF